MLFCCMRASGLTTSAGQEHQTCNSAARRRAASIDALTSADAIVGACADDARCRGTLATWLCTQPPEMDVPSIRDRPTALRRVASGHSRPVHPNDRKCRRRDSCQFATQRTRVGSDRIESASMLTSYPSRVCNVLYYWTIICVSAIDN